MVFFNKALKAGLGVAFPSIALTEEQLLAAASNVLIEGAPKAIRKALMWSSVGDNEGDAHVEEVCRANGVIPMMMASMDKSQAALLDFIEDWLCRR